MGPVVSTLCRFGGIAGAAAALLGAGCASSDLSQKPETTSEVVEALPTDSPAPTEIVRAVWFPNSSGFGSTDASPLGHSSGVLALAGDSLFFLAWNGPEHHYDVLHVIAIPKMTTVTVAHAGPLAMLVIQSSNLSFDSFELMKGGQFISDPPATQELCDKLQALLAKVPPLAPL